MGKIYQPIVIERATEIVEMLEESNFFIDYELSNSDFALEYFKEKLTEKFILGTLEEDDFTEDDFDLYLREIVAGTLLNELKAKGYVESYEDENTEEVFFLTEEGKKYLNKNI